MILLERYETDTIVVEGYQESDIRSIMILYKNTGKTDIYDYPETLGYEKAMFRLKKMLT